MMVSIIVPPMSLLLLRRLLTPLHLHTPFMMIRLNLLFSEFTTTRRPPSFANLPNISRHLKENNLNLNSGYYAWAHLGFGYWTTCQGMLLEYRLFLNITHSISLTSRPKPKSRNKQHNGWLSLPPNVNINSTWILVSWVHGHPISVRLTS
jgi:hypothetical protein